MKAFIALSFIVFLVAMVSATKVELIEYTPNCGGFNEPKICEAVYLVTNDAPIELSVSASTDLDFKYRTETDAEIKQDIPQVENEKTLYSIDGKDYYDDPKIIEKITAGSSFYVKNQLEKKWVSTGIGNEEYLESVDHIPSFFGVDYPEWAWYYTSFPYRIKSQMNNTNGIVFAPFVANLTIDTQTKISQGKMQADCDDLRITWLNNSDSSEIPISYYFYGKYGRFGSTIGGCNSLNTVMHGRLPYVYAGGENTSIYYYYGDITATEGSNMNTTYGFTEDWDNGYNASKWYNGTGGSINTACANCVIGSGYYRVSGSASAGFVYINNNTAILNSTYQNYSALLFLYKTVTTVTALRNIYAIDSTGAFTTHLMTTLPSTYTPISMAWTSSRSYTRRLDTGALVETGILDRFLAGGLWSQTSASSADFTNVTLVNWAPMPFDASNMSYGSEETLDSGTFNLTVFDETTSSQIYFNATLSNGTSSYSTANGLVFSVASNTLPQGTVTLTIQNASYYIRSLQITITNSSQTISAYLLSIANPNNIFVRFHAIDLSGNALPNATISIYKSSNLIANGLTDDSGTFSNYLDYTTTYTISASKTGYPSVSVSIMPVQQDYYIRLSQFVSANFSYMFSNITWYLKPDTRSLSINNTYIQFSIISADNQLEYYGLALEYNGSIFYNQALYVNYGGNITISLNVSNYSNYIIAHPYFKKIGFPEYYDNSTILYILVNSTHLFDNSLMAELPKLKSQANLGFIGYGLFLIIVGLIIAGMITNILNVGHGLIGLIIVGILGALGLFSLGASTPFLLTDYGEVLNPAYWGWFMIIGMFILALYYFRILR